jgi:hypothetical protein
MARARRILIAGLLAMGAIRCSSFDGAAPVPPGSDAGDAAVDGVSASDGGPDAAVSDGSTGCMGAFECERVVFVTSLTYEGNLLGADGADEKCNALARASDLPRVSSTTFQAWVSTTASDSGTPDAQTDLPGAVTVRFKHGTGAYVSTDGKVIAKSWTDLTDATLQIGITKDENGMPVQADDIVWTGTSASGELMLPGCSEWATATSAEAIVGKVAKADLTWTESLKTPCGNVAHLYCFEK